MNSYNLVVGKLEGNKLEEDLKLEGRIALTWLWKK
jgi:hypothetical protein